MAIGYCHLTIISLHQARLSFATSGLHLACWKSEDWVRPIICKRAEEEARKQAEQERLEQEKRHEPPLCEHDISCILGLRRKLLRESPCESLIFTLFIHCMFILVSEINVTSFTICSRFFTTTTWPPRECWRSVDFVGILQPDPLH